VRARLAALRRGDYPPQAALGLIKPGIAAVLPGPVREMARRISGKKAA
jgi:hypothetical protein